jgi:signal peptidase I
MKKYCSVCNGKVKFDIETQKYKCIKCGQEFLESKVDKPETQKDEPVDKKQLIKSIISWVVTIVICLASAKLFTTFVVSSVEVDGTSMYSTLDDGDKALTDAMFFKMGKINRFDIVIIKMNSGPHKGEKLVKRVIALPGETIEYKDSTLYINGEVVEEDFLVDAAKEATGTIIKTTLGEDEYFVMGDNRGASSDSRRFGFVEKKEIKGRGLLRFMVCTKKDSTGECIKRKFVWPSSVK